MQNQAFSLTCTAAAEATLPTLVRGQHFKCKSHIFFGYILNRFQNQSALHKYSLLKRKVLQLQQTWSYKVHVSLQGLAFAGMGYYVHIWGFVYMQVNGCQLRLGDINIIHISISPRHQVEWQSMTMAMIGMMTTRPKITSAQHPWKNVYKLSQ